MKMHLAKGYLLLEVLIAVIVILGLTLWWMRIQASNNRASMAKIMTQQIHSILNASSNYYINNPASQSDWPNNLTIEKLVAQHYLLEKDATNPFGHPYLLQVNDKWPNLLLLKTTVSHNDASIAYRAIATLADATVHVPKDDHANVTLRVFQYQPTPGSSPNNLKYIGDTNYGGDIYKSKMHCPTTYRPEIILTQKNCNDCKAAAADYGEFWRVYNSQWSKQGWVPAFDKPIQVSLTCKKWFQH